MLEVRIEQPVAELANAVAPGVARHVVASVLHGGERVRHGHRELARIEERVVVLRIAHADDVVRR